MIYLLEESVVHWDTEFGHPKSVLATRKMFQICQCPWSRYQSRVTFYTLHSPSLMVGECWLTDWGHWPNTKPQKLYAIDDRLIKYLTTTEFILHQALCLCTIINILTLPVCDEVKLNLFCVTIKMYWNVWDKDCSD